MATLPKRQQFVLSLTALCLAWLGQGDRPCCAQDDPKFATDDLQFFEKKIRPVLVEQCYACHSADAAKANKLKGNLLVDTRAGLLKGGDSGPAVAPGDLDESLILDALRYESLQMPPKGKLPASVIADFETWITRGAADPRRGDAAAPVRAGIDIAAGRQHWAYRPLVRQPIPEVSRLDTATFSPIDAFVLSKLAANQLSFAPEADRAALARRLSFDLTGLPPSPEEVDAFVADSTPDAYERLVDRLLASPHFGERWGRHWLSVARFAESLTLRGFVLPEAWRYRDYVIDTFNHDRPFDRFIVEQVAGDLLPASSLEERRRNVIATSFLALGNINLEEQDKKQLRMDAVDEQIDAIAKGFLAQTVTCARCHDHKFDPIPTRDYYALAGILRNTKTLEHANVSKWLEFPLPLEPEREAVMKQQEAAVAVLQERIKTVKEAAKLLAGGGAKSANASGGAVLAAKDLPGIVVDDKQAKVVGEWKLSQYTKSYIGDGYLHDLGTGKGEKTITLLPELKQAGKYEVRLAYTPGVNRSEAVPVTVFSADGEKTIKVNQRETPPIDGRFVSLGQYRFELNGQGFVIVSNEGTRDHVIVDAVQFLPVEMLMAENAPAAKKPEGDAAKETDEQKAAAAKLAKEQRDLEQELKLLVDQGPKRPMYLSVQEEMAIADTHVHIRGTVHNLGERVPRGFLQVATYGTPAPVPDSQSGRKELGEWIASRENPLTPRVLANRTWCWLFGTGLVRTTDNFGTTGETPSHPELLDYLALRLLDENWSVKQLVREIVLSHTYRQSTAADPRKLAADPENRWLSHRSRRRLEAECLLDTILTASGRLRTEVGGKTIRPGLAEDYGFRHDSTRRAVYWPVFRNSLPEIFEVFDFADPSTVNGTRNTSTVAPQALFFMNDTWVIAESQFAAKRLLAESHPDDQSRLYRAFRLTLGRSPTAAESQLALGYFGAPATGREEFWSQLFQALFASMDFRYVE